MTSPSTCTGGRLPTITFVHRSAAFLKASFCFLFKPPRKRTVISNPAAAAAPACNAAPSPVTAAALGDLAT